MLLRLALQPIVDIIKWGGFMNTKILYELVRASPKNQREIAQDLGMSQQRFNNYVNGQREPDMETASAIADYFHVSLDYLAGKEIPASETESGKAWAERLRALSPSDLSLFVQVLDSLEENPAGTRAALGLALTAAQAVRQSP